MSEDICRCSRSNDVSEIMQCPRDNVFSNLMMILISEEVTPFTYINFQLFFKNDWPENLDLVRLI